MSVKDAIEMTRLGTAAYQDDTASNAAKFSPDGQRFAVVLKRGNLERNVNEYQLLVFKTNRAWNSPKPEFSTTLSSASNREAIKGIKWLRDNRTLMFVGERGKSSQVFSLDLPSHAIRQVTHSRTPVVLFDASEDGKTVVYEADPGNENPLAKTDIRRNGVVVSSQDLADLVLSATPASYFSTRKSRDLFLLRRGEAPRRIETSDGIAANLVLSVAPNGKYALVEAWVHNVPPQWSDYKDHLLHEFITADRSKGANALVERYLVLDTASGKIVPLIDAPKSWEHDGFYWILGGDALVLSRAYLPLTGVGTEEKQRRMSGKYVIEVDPDKHSFVKIADEPFVAQEWSEETKTLTVSRRSGEAERSETTAWRRAGNSWVPAQPASHPVTILPTIRYEQDMNSPPKITISRPETNETKTLIDLNPNFKDICFATERLIHWMATDKHPVNGGLYLPPDFHPGHRYPLVIQTHAFDAHKFWIDGPWSSAFAAQPLAARGIAVLQIGSASDGSDAQFRSTPMEAPRQMAAFEGAVDYLDQAGIIDRDRVGIIGFSRTGYHVAYTLTHSQYHWAAATMADCFTGGYFAQVAFRNGVSEPNAVNGGPPYGQSLSLWLDRSPSFLMTNLKTPVRLESYGLASAIEQWEWFSLSSQLKKPVDFIVLPEGVHVLVRPSDRFASQQGNVDWFDYWMNREIDQRPAKRDQYTRWEQMRHLVQPSM